jgi:hypothetical protein
MFRIFGLILMGLAPFLMIWRDGPDLVRDFQLRNQALVPANQALLNETNCELNLLVLTRCEVKYTFRDTTSGPRFLYFSVLGPLPTENVHLLAVASDPTQIVSDTGMTYLIRRIVSGAAYIGALGALAYFFALRRVGLA